MDRDPLARNGLYLSLAAQANAVRNDPSTADLVADRPVMDGVCASRLVTAPTGEYFAMPGLREGTRLRALGAASDVEWLLQHHGSRNQYPHITALSLQRGVLLLRSAAKNFVEAAAKDVAAWTMLRGGDRDYRDLVLTSR